MSGSPSDGGALAPAPSSSSTAVRVFICDDAPEFCQLMRIAIEAEPGLSVVGEAGSGRKCVAAIGRLRPDVVLLDLSMDNNDRDGLWALPRIRATVPDSRVIILSAFSEQLMGARARAAGAHDYIEKGASLIRIIGAVREAAGQRPAGGRFR
jgi:DNA-binding NarL/FixJ family response regulator